MPKTVDNEPGEIQRLLEAEERARRLSDATLEGVVLHEGGVILEANRPFAKMFGRELSAVHGMRIAQFLTEEYRELAAAGAEPRHSYEAVGLHADGSTFPVKIYNKTAPYQGRTVQVAALRDITERKRTEQALRESEMRYRELFENANDLIYTHDLRGVITSLNKTAERLTGFTQAEGIGKNLAEFIAPESIDIARDAMMKGIRGRKTAAYEVELVRKDGGRITVEVSTRTIFKDARPVGVQGIGRDISERKRMEAELHYRMRFEELIAGISTHFINLSPDELDRGIEHALMQIGEFTGVDRAYIFMFDELGMRKSHEWCAAGIEPQPGMLKAVSYDNFPWLSERFKQREIIYIPEVGALPAEAEVERELFARQDIKSVLAVPMIKGRTLVGFLGLDSVRTAKGWSEATISIVKFVGEVFVNALERRRAEEALLESEERYKLASLGANDGLWDWNLRSGEVYFSPRWKSMLGYADHEIGSHADEWFGRMHPDDVERVKADIESHFEGRSPHFENEYRMREKEGLYRWMLCRGIAIRDASGRAYRAAGSQTDISVRKDAEEKLFFDAFHDALTGLPNRALFLDRLDRSIRRAVRRDGYQFAVLFMDLDRFKVINDSLGHSAGDQLLIGIARRLENCLRPGDTIARLGGDEFTILIEDVMHASDATHVAERILEELGQPFSLSNQEVFSSASIGIALGGPNYDHPEEMLRDADTAMYRAKAQGKMRYAVFDAPMHARALELLHLETELRRAVERDDFQVLYQPIIDLKSGKISGFEALLRWHHPLRGVMLTSQVIPLAEETGLIVPIGRWVLREACRQMKDWVDRFDLGRKLSMSVNLSGKQFMQNTLLKQVQQAIDDSGLDPRTLRLEITESVLMENAESATAIVSQLRVMEINLHIDDFGTGYSSLSYLHRFPIDTLKIDRSFIARMTYGDEIEIVRTITSLAHHLGKSVIAEGVETREQLEKLRSLGVEQAQGYLFSKPLDPAEVEALLKRDPVW
jgi:diguanylate cyclase (GGDEF)-like protein/PAS domain S-box-containing protein